MADIINKYKENVRKKIKEESLVDTIKKYYKYKKNLKVKLKKLPERLEILLKEIPLDLNSYNFHIDTGGWGYQRDGRVYFYLTLPFDFQLDNIIASSLKDKIGYSVSDTLYSSDKVIRSYHFEMDNNDYMYIKLDSSRTGSTCKINILKEEVEEYEDAIYEIVCPKALEEPIFE